MSAISKESVGFLPFGVIDDASAPISTVPSFSGKKELTVSLFSVIVPVLSVQRISILPRSSIADNLLTTTLCFASRNAPLENENVVTTGKASGITLIARAIAKIMSVGIFTLDPLRRILITTINIRVEAISLRINALSLLIPFSKLLSCFVSTVNAVILPIVVFFPVFKTTPSPSPLTIVVPENPIFCALYI